MSNRVSGHSGWPESVELERMAQTAKIKREKQEKQLNTICGVLDKLPHAERRAILAKICRHYMDLEG